MREWLDVDSRLFPKPSQPSVAAPPLQIVPENSPPPKISLDEQLAKRSLHEYLGKGEEILSDYRTEVAQSENNPCDSSRLKRIADKLGRYGLDSDSWGFDDVYLVVQQLQFLALEMFQGRHIGDAATTRQIARGLDLLQGLLRDCERDYDRRLAVAAYLHSFASDEAV